MSYSVLEWGIVILQNCLLITFNKRFYNKKGCYLCQALYTYIATQMLRKSRALRGEVKSLSAYNFKYDSQSTEGGTRAKT